MSVVPHDPGQSLHDSISAGHVPRDGSSGSAPSLPAIAGDQPFWERFINSFFQERNIKWMLVIGAAIVFGSSLMLVTRAWPAWSPAVKYLTILGYSAGIFVASEICRRRLHLPATYRVLQGLTLLLLPINFLALSWLSSGTAVQTLGDLALEAVLFLPTLALTFWSARCILDHWLCTRQTTFLVCYVLLCVAGVCPAMGSPLASTLLTIALWVVFSVGVVKVNRHTFWLAIEHRLPRVFGFLPIVLLGLQMTLLVATKTLGQLPPQWLGFVVVLISATVLFTARTVAQVFRQRTGDLVRPLPMEIVISLLSGLFLTLLGVALSMWGISFVGSTTYAIVPTAIMAAALWIVVARDTRQSGFVWGCLLLICMAYQFSPTLFGDLTATLRSTAAAAIAQPRVPLAMYGVTYLPLLAVLALVGRHFARRQQTWCSRPVQQFVTLVAAALIVLAATALATSNFVPLAIVASANGLAFIGFALCFNDRRYAVAACLLIVVSVGISIPALNQMQWIQLDNSWIMVALSALALLMTSTRWPDRWMQRIALPTDRPGLTDDGGSAELSVESIGAALAWTTGGFWILQTMVSFFDPIPLASQWQFGLLITALSIHLLRRTQYLFTWYLWGMAGIALVRLALCSNVPGWELISGAFLVMATASVLSYLTLRCVIRATPFQSRNQLRQALGFDAHQIKLTPVDHTLPLVVRQVACIAVSLFDVSKLVLGGLIAATLIPMLACQHLSLMTDLGSGLVSHFVLRSMVASAAIWLLILSIVDRDRMAGSVLSALAPVLVSGLLLAMPMHMSIPWLLVVWTTTAAIVSLAQDRLRAMDAPNSESSDCQQSASHQHPSVAHFWLVALVSFSFLSFDHPMRLIPLIAIPTLLFTQRKHGTPQQRCGLVILASLQVFMLAAALCGCHGALINVVLYPPSLAVIAPLFLIATLNLLLFEYQPVWLRCAQCDRWGDTMRLIASLLAIASLAISHSIWGLVFTGVGFVLLTISNGRNALLQNSRTYAWATIATIATAIAFFDIQSGIALTMPVRSVLAIAFGVLGLVGAKLTSESQRWQVMSGPLSIVGNGLPAVSVAMQMGALMLAESATPVGALAVMLSSAVYFHQACVWQRKWLFVPASIIVNMGLIILWNSLGWHAPELILVPIGVSILALVELLHRELPDSTHTPLRYLGTLAILMSPMFQVIGGDWLHILVLMFLSVAVILAAIGLRIRALVYAGTAFLFVDLLAMVIRSSINNPSMLWICGLVLGVGVIALAAVCENKRENLLARIRLLSAELATWS